MVVNEERVQVTINGAQIEKSFCEKKCYSAT